MTENDVGRLTKTRHGLEGLRNSVADPHMMVGNAKMACNVRIRLRTGFRPMPDDPHGSYALINGLRYEGYLVPRLSQMPCQGCELAEPTAVYECYMHAHKPIAKERSEHFQEKRVTVFRSKVLAFKRLEEARPAGRARDNQMPNRAALPQTSSRRCKVWNAVSRFRRSCSP